MRNESKSMQVPNAKVKNEPMVLDKTNHIRTRGISNGDDSSVVVRNAGGEERNGKVGQAQKVVHLERLYVSHRFHRPSFCLSTSAPEELSDRSNAGYLGIASLTTRMSTYLSRRSSRIRVPSLSPISNCYNRASQNEVVVLSLYAS